MAAITIRNLDDDVRDRLRVRAAEHGRSMEAEARAILAEAVGKPEEPQNLVAALVAAAQSVGGVELDIPPRTELPRSLPDFSDW